MEFKEIIRDLRLLKNMTQEQMALKLGKQLRSYQRLESGEGNPNIGTIIDIATKFNVSADYLLGIDVRNNTDTDDSKMTYKFISLLTKNTKNCALDWTELNKSEDGVTFNYFEFLYKKEVSDKVALDFENSKAKTYISKANYNHGFLYLIQKHTDHGLMYATLYLNREDENDLYIHIISGINYLGELCDLSLKSPTRNKKLDYMKTFIESFEPIDLQKEKVKIKKVEIL